MSDKVQVPQFIQDVIDLGRLFRKEDDPTVKLARVVAEWIEGGCQRW